MLLTLHTVEDAVLADPELMAVLPVHAPLHRRWADARSRGRRADCQRLAAEFLGALTDAEAEALGATVRRPDPKLTLDARVPIGEDIPAGLAGWNLCLTRDAGEVRVTGWR